MTMPDGGKVALGIPQAQRAMGGDFADIPLRRPGTAAEAAGVILAVASPLFSYVDGQTIMVSFCNMQFLLAVGGWTDVVFDLVYRWPEYVIRTGSCR